MLKRSVFIAIVAGGLVPHLAITAIRAATSDPYTYGSSATPNRILIAGVTLGNGWSGFPDTLAADYSATGSLDRLDVTLPLYVTWLLDSNSSSFPAIEEISPPKLITDYASDWFTYTAFSVLNIETQAIDQEYTACAASNALEAPTVSSTPLTSDGKVNVKDIHGGIHGKTTIHLRRCVQGTDGNPCGYNLNIVLGWTKPRTEFDDKLGTTVNLDPGDVCMRRATINGFNGYIPVRVVEWVSVDVGYASRRAVDAADLSAFAAHHVNPPVPIRWGWASGESPTNSPNFHVNFAPFGSSALYLDASDLAAWSSDSGKSCGLSKTTPDESPAAILSWFGYAPTGRDIVYGANGETGPEYELVDPVQKDRAIADPYGYRSNTAAARIPWGEVKSLYK